MPLMYIHTKDAVAGLIYSTEKAFTEWLAILNWDSSDLRRKYLSFSQMYKIVGLKIGVSKVYIYLLFRTFLTTDITNS